MALGNLGATERALTYATNNADVARELTDVLHTSALTDGDNTFSGSNTFSGTNTMTGTMTLQGAQIRSTVLAAVDAATVIAVGDLLWQDTDDAKPASDVADGGTEAANQETLHDQFLGVALTASAADETDPVLVATSGLFTFTCPSGTFELGALVGADENGAGTALLNQTVASVATANLAIGRVAVRVPSAATSVVVEITSTIMYAGPQTVA